VEGALEDDDRRFPGRVAAILTAFSTASTPLLTSMTDFGPSPGTAAISFSASRTGPSYGVTMKQVWVNFSACSLMAATTLGWEWPTFMTAMPPPKSR